MADGMTAADFWEKRRAGKILIVGFGERTGQKAAQLFTRMAVPFRISDSAPWSELAPRLEGIARENVDAGEQHPRQLEAITSILLSPGVSPSIPLLRAARERAIPIESDIAFLYDLVKHKKLVGITGTDGKTTTTTLTGDLLANRGKVVVAGNIGISPLGKYEEIVDCDFLVLELSSYMLEAAGDFRPNYAAILNIAEDHIDRYSSMDDYANAKYQIARHCTPQDILIRNIDDPRLRSFHPKHVQLMDISRRAGAAAAASWYSDGFFHVGGQRYAYANCRLQGQQNIPNILAASTIAHAAGVSPAAIRTTLERFDGLPHRMQLVGEFGGVRVYDDSKASNVHAVEAALKNFDKGVILILGGRDKGLDFGRLKSHEKRVRKLICYGEDGQRIKDRLQFHNASYVYPFADAVRQAVDESRRGDVILLSPGCTSWDQFANYEVRGNTFRELAMRHFQEKGDVFHASACQ